MFSALDQNVFGILHLGTVLTREVSFALHVRGKFEYTCYLKKHSHESSIQIECKLYEQTEGRFWDSQFSRVLFLNV